MKVGDRVEVVEDYDGVSKGMKGVIKRIENDGIHAVEMDNWSNGEHSCQGMCKNGYGEWIREKRLKVTPEFQFGQRVYVWDSDEVSAGKRIFLFKDPREGVEAPYYCVGSGDKKDFNDKGSYGILSWRHCKPTPKPDKKQELLDKIEELKVKVRELE